MKYGISLLLVLTLLTACTTVPGEPDSLLLPDVQEYSKEEQTAAALELEQYGDKLPTIMNKILPGCKVMRDQTRAIKAILDEEAN